MEALAANESSTEHGSTSLPHLATQASWVFAFGPFRLDPVRQVVTRGSGIVPLSQRLYDLLVALVRANGCIVSRESLYSLVWPVGGVSENNLSQHIYMLRKALGERAGDCVYIATIHCQGFRLVPPVKVVDLAHSVVRQERGSVEEAGAPNLSVIHGYSRGCRSLEFGTAIQLRAATEHFKSTLRNSPDFVPSLVGLAKARLLLAINNYSPGSNEFPKAKEAVLRALQLDSSRADAHAILSNVILFCDWNWREARRELDIALQLDWNNPTVRVSSARLSAWIGEPITSLNEIQRAVVSEPSSPAIQLLLGRAMIDTGDIEGAIEHFSDLMESHPDHEGTARRYRAEALLLNERPTEAILDLQLLPQERVEDLAFRLPMLALAHAHHGDVDRAQGVYDTLIALKQTEFIASSNLLSIALSLGHRKEALEHFSESLKQREPMLPLLRHSPWISGIRQSPVFKALLRAIGDP